uniref:Amidase domain-containing protein n=1 Tax=Heliothis virescens TaxID=7102 RepID=A0A2A4J9E8_HELVI
MMNAFMRRFLRFMVSLLAIIVVPLTYLLNIRRNKKCPPPMNPILFKSATSLAAMIRTRQITSEQVVEAYIERCKEANPYLNAIVEPRYDAALREARGIDKMIASTDRTPEDLEKEYPLLGVPMTVKESIAVEGMSNDCGTVYPYRNPAKSDAAVIRLARAAGAIPIAVTNTPQLCMNWETYNNVIGITTNPYDQKRTTGGSSGGESALISAAGSVIGVGSDIAGSLRLPPMFTGIFGHKPTPRLLSVEGHVPDCLDPDFEEYFTLGPITRYAEDLTLLLKVLKQPGGPDVPLDKPVDISKLKFYYMDGDGSNVSDSIGPDVRRAMEKAKDHIKNTYNIEVKPLKIKNIEHMWETSIRILLNIKHVRNIYTDPEKRDQWVSVWPEVLKTLVGMSNHNFICVCYGPLTKFFDALPKSYYKKLLSIFDEIKAEFDSALISAAGSVIGVGSDIAGSLRLPPMFTGIFGHKPTPRLLSVEGHVPDCLDPDFEEYFTLGPITRYAEDLTLLLKVLKQPGGPDVPLDKPVDISKLKFYYMDGDGSNVSDSIGPDVRRAMEKAKDHIKNTYNIEVKPLKIKNIEHMWETSIRILLNIKHVRNIYTDPEKRDQWVSVWPEVLKTLVGMSNHNFICVCYGPLTKFFDALPKSYYKKLLSIFDEIKAEFDKVLADDVVLLHPTFPTPAHLHYRIYYKFLNSGYLTIFNALGLPVTQCPIGLTRKGLPVGIQIAANKCNDHLTIAVAKEFEKAFGGWIPPNKELANNIKTA